MFNVGDVVRLKHSTYRMTVDTVIDQSQPTPHIDYMCLWFNKNQEIQRGVFREDILTDATVKDFNTLPKVTEE